jgi:hypothetical protein
MKIRSLVLEALARCYEDSQAGQTGIGTIDIQPGLQELLAQAGCNEGDAYELALRELREAAVAGLLTLEPAHKRARADIHKVRLSPEKEEAFYAYLDRPSPTAIRRRWSDLFREAMTWPAPEDFPQPWTAFCESRAAGALCWKNMAEFRRSELVEGREMLRIVSRLLDWSEPEHFIRAASCRICGDSKRLERQRRPLEKLLKEASGGRIQKFGDLRILDMPRHVLVAGPLQLRLADHTLDFRQWRDGLSVSESDLDRSDLQCGAFRCVTVENKTTFHQRTLLNPQDLHIHTSYPNAAALMLLRKLPPNLDFLHLGDSDPAGFDILRELREASKLPFRSLGMEFQASAQGKMLTPEEVQLLETLSCSPWLRPERPALQALLTAGHKGAFEQEHRLP